MIEENNLAIKLLAKQFMRAVGRTVGKTRRWVAPGAMKAGSGRSSPVVTSSH